jgi:hypothetical protein
MQKNEDTNPLIKYRVELTIFYRAKPPVELKYETETTTIALLLDEIDGTWNLKYVPQFNIEVRRIYDYRS